MQAGAPIWGVTGNIRRSPNGRFTFDNLYRYPVPVPALMIAGQIVGAVPKVQVLVSDIFYVDDMAPDPFLAIRVPNYTYEMKNMIVVAHWDEPGFVIKSDKDE